MKYRKYLVIISLLHLCIVSCKKDFLDVVDNRVLTRQNYVKDLTSMQSFLTGTYVMLNELFEQGLGRAYPELVADNLKPLALPPRSLWLHYVWSQQKDDVAEFSVGGTSLNMNGAWCGGYHIVRACNFVIEDVDKYRTENPEKADDVKGQAYALRALIYFELVNEFAQNYTYSAGATHPGIPYITTSDVSKPYYRETVAAVYNAMIADLNNAIALLPAGAGDSRYMNRAAARALLARVFLFMEDYAAAKKLALEICNEIPLLTIAGGYPNGLFMKKSPGETEVLFQATPGDSYYSNFIGGWLRGDFIQFNATNDIAAILRENPNDARSSWVENVSGLWNVTKFPVSVTGDPPLRAVPGFDYYHPVIRSSEMFLTVAEAAAKTGDEDNARGYLDLIRKRADPSIAPVTATGTALIDLIYKERRKELAFEGLRMYDLQRWKSGVHRTDVVNGGTAILPYPSNKAISPIPLKDVQLAGLQQNMEY